MDFLVELVLGTLLIIVKTTVVLTLVFGPWVIWLEEQLRSQSDVIDYLDYLPSRLEKADPKDFWKK